MYLAKNTYPKCPTPIVYTPSNIEISIFGTIVGVCDAALGEFIDLVGDISTT